ncbi:MAG TPA: ABC transporter ATP-binding protein [Bacteroidota bacterium]|nr:ABC transporter ATP-binding protein [Bacteroidota bacterium]
MTSELILQTKNLGKQYKSRWAVHHLDLEVHRGDVFGFLGPNGAGKSTTIRMLLSLIRPTEGEVFLFGKSLEREREQALLRIGGIVEKPDFYAYLSAKRNLEIVGALNGGASSQRIAEVLDLVGLGSRAADKVKTYSHGMKQRLGIAQALLADPEFIILDEPTSGLDPQGMKEIRDLIRHLASDQNKTVLLSSHLLNEVEMVATRMAVINRGELVTQGEVAALLSKGEKVVSVTGRPVEKIRTVLAARGITEIRQKGDALEAPMQFEDVPEFARALVHEGVDIQALVPRRSLEEYFLSITEGSASEGRDDKR